MQLLLARHGQTEWNVQQRIQGWGDSSLTELGQKQAQSLADRIRSVKLADKISNVRDVGERPAVGWSIERRVEYLDWAKRVVDALPLQDHVLNEIFRRAVENSRRQINKPTQFTAIRRATAEDYRKADGYSVGTFHRPKAPDFKEPQGTQPPQRAALEIGRAHV